MLLIKGTIYPPAGYNLSGKRDSNPRPAAWEAAALPTELFPQKDMDVCLFRHLDVETQRERFENSHSAITDPCLCGDRRIRTSDTVVNSHSLYLLSYAPLIQTNTYDASSSYATSTAKLNVSTCAIAGPNSL